MIDISVIDTLYGGSITSDAVLLLKEESGTEVDNEGGPPASKRQKVLDDGRGACQPQECQIMAHRAVLWPLSEYFESKIKNWSDNANGSTDSSKCAITLLVPPGQMEIGKALLVTMYSHLPEQLSQQELLQLLALAESYKIDKVTSAAVIHFNSMPTEQLEWETVLALLQLPKEPLYEPASKAAMSRMLQLLGDLDIVWGLERPAQRVQLQRQILLWHDAAATAVSDAERIRDLRAAEGRLALFRSAVTAAEASEEIPLHELLLQLPFELFITLLQSEHCLSASEDSVHYTMTRWVQQQDSVSASQCERLLGLLNLDRCSPMYLLSAVLGPSSWVVSHMAADTAARWMALCVAKQQKLHDIGGLSRSLLQLDGVAPYRKSSVLKSQRVNLRVPVEDLRMRYIEAMEDEEDAVEAVAVSPVYYLQGREFQLNVTLNVYADSIWGSRVGSPRYLRATVEAVGTPALFDCHYRCGDSGDGNACFEFHTAAGGQHHRKEIGESGLLLVCHNTVASYTFPAQQKRAVFRGELPNWEAIERWLRAPHASPVGVVHDCGCIHVSAEISNVR